MIFRVSAFFITMDLNLLACTKTGFWANWSLTCKDMLHLNLNVIIMHLWVLWVFTHGSILRKQYSNVKEHNGKMLLLNVQHRNCRVNYFYWKEDDYSFWINFLRNNLVYILPSFIHIFHYTSGHSNNLLLVDIKAFFTSCVHCMACDFTNPAKVADLKLPHHTSSPEISVQHCCGYPLIFTADQDSRR